MKLGAFLALAGARHRIDGEWDCATFPADWAVACGWPDPMARWRGTYSCEEEAISLIAEHGSLAAMFGVGCAKAGIPVVDADNDWRGGDVGVLTVLGHEAGAIFTGKRWALVAPRGLAFASIDPADVCHVWRPVRG